MTSTTGARRSVSGLLVRGSAVVCLVAGHAAMAQEPSALVSLVFEPVPLAAALAAPIALDGPRADLAALTDEVEQRAAAVEALRGRRSSRAGLIEQLGLLAVAYQGLDRHAEALDALDEAIDLVRSADGRNSLDQIPLHEQKIPSLLALDDIRAIDDTEELIYGLRERSFDPGGREMYYATMNLADWYTAAYYRENYGAGNRMLRRQMAVLPRVQRCIRIPGVTPPTECETNPIFTGEIKDVSERDINDLRLRKIDRLYAGFQDDLIEGGNVQLDIILDLGRRIARLAFAT